MTPFVQRIKEAMARACDHYHNIPTEDDLSQVEAKAAAQVSIDEIEQALNNGFNMAHNNPVLTGTMIVEYLQSRGITEKDKV